MVPLIVIRPEPGCAATAEAARALGLETVAQPLFAIEPRSWQAPLAADFDALLIGSANVLRHGGRGLDALKNLPVYAVGETTAQAARERGFTVAASGSGGLQAVVDMLPPGTRHVLRLAGDERVPLTLPKAMTMEERVTYASVPCPFTPGLIDLLRRPAIVAVHSAEAMRHLTAQCVSHAIRRSPLRIAALGPRIAQAAEAGWGEVAVAQAPNDKALLALARQMCQDPFP
ncbi:uroporphyrinogen-III synthase [Novosphingobium sp. B 225]|uniref:uroporphyrinogen-III synthase n=1 Tax=Novosphingobium sp. B 225 TaxID=1961849 RepID=UPI000B4B7120|nr:uroporphyrinogen-III synthase [Novosphingobium sp. B 225]